MNLPKILITANTKLDKEYTEELKNYIYDLFPQELVHLDISSAYSSYLAILIKYESIENYSKQTYWESCDTLEFYMVKNQLYCDKKIKFSYI